MWRYPSAPEFVSFIENISILAGDHLSGSNRGIVHFFQATRNTIKGVRKKEQTNNMLGLTQMQEVKLWHSAFLCVCRLTLAWISSEISTKLLGMPTHLDRSSFTAAGLSHADWSLLLSGVDWPLASPFANSFCGFLLPTPYSLSLPTSGRGEISSPNPLSGFAPKQTKESSAWRTTYIVSQ